MKTKHVKLTFEVFKHKFPLECSVLEILPKLNKGILIAVAKG